MQHVAMTRFYVGVTGLAYNAVIQIILVAADRDHRGRAEKESVR
jgi:hypothetical protein